MADGLLQKAGKAWRKYADTQPDTWLSEAVAGAVDKLTRPEQKPNPLQGWEIKGKPYTSMTDEELSSVHNPFLDKLRQNASNPNQFEVTPQELLESYYGDNYGEEVSKAKAYYGSGGGRGQQFDKLQTPVKVVVQQDPEYEAHYNKKTNVAMLHNPGYQSWEMRRGQELAGESPINPGRVNPNIGTAEFLTDNSYTPDDLVFMYRNPVNNYAQTAEHEIGHAFDKSLVFPPSIYRGGSHVTQSDEYLNALGKVQRDTYAIYGRRFEDPSTFGAWLEVQRKLPTEKRFKNYSSESKRLLRNIIKEYDSSDSPFGIWQKAMEDAPSLIKSGDSRRAPVA